MRLYPRLPNRFAAQLFLEQSVLPLDEILKYLDAWRAEKAGQVGYANNAMEYLKDLGLGEDYKGLR